MLISLTGYKRSGKSTAAEYLAEKHNCTRINFKDALVQELKDGFPDLLREIQEQYGNWNDKDMWVTPTVDELFETKPPLMRALMQNFGTDVRRKDKDDYWVNKWEIAYTKAHPEPVVVDDVRFLNEAEAVRKMGGVIIRIERTDITSGGEHQSETEQDSISVDYTISVEKGDHEGLYREIDRVINERHSSGY